MKNIMYRCLAAGALLLTIPALAQSEAPVSAAQAQQNLQQKLAAMQQYRAGFDQTVTDIDGEVVYEASGQLEMARPDKLRWETSMPDETLLIADGRAVWNVDPFVEQVTILDQQRAVQDNPIVLLTSDSAQQWQQFDIAQPQANTFTITPKDGEGQIQQLELIFDEQTLTGLTMLDAQQQSSRLQFNDINTGFKPALSRFEVTIPDTYIIDDQR